MFIANAVSAKSMDDLRGSSYAELCRLQEELSEKLMASGGDLAFTPVVNGELIKYPADEAVQRGLIANIPVMIGSTKNDMTVTPEEAAGDDSRFPASCKGWAL